MGKKINEKVAYESSLENEKREMEKMTFVYRIFLPRIVVNHHGFDVSIFKAT